ncbi:MAG: methyltransferase [Bacteroidota bacterium]
MAPSDPSADLEPGRGFQPEEGGITTDTLLRGRVTLLQPVHGFRSSLDPVLLAAFVRPPFGRFVDIGCGTGALAFLLAATDDRATGVGVEIQPRLASLARAGAARNSFGSRIQILEADVRTAVGRAPLDRGGFSLVATNPPYRPVSDGLPSPDPERARANHEVTLRLDDWLDAAVALVRPRGRLAVVFPAERIDALLSGLDDRDLAPSRMRLVHPRQDRPATRVLLEAVAGMDARSAVPIEPPLVVHEVGGGFTPEVKRMVGEPFAGGDDRG